MGPCRCNVKCMERMSINLTFFSRWLLCNFPGAVQSTVKFLKALSEARQASDVRVSLIMAKICLGLIASRLFCLWHKSSKSPEAGQDHSCLQRTEAVAYLLVATCLQEIMASLTCTLSRLKLYRRCKRKEEYPQNEPLEQINK